ncbi:MAG: DUF3276 family protein [Bacteroidota bacterium]
MQGRDEVYSEKIRAGKRTYFFDVRSTRSNDYYITITESKRRFNGRGYDKHKIFLYKEDFNKFLASLTKTINHVKTELMPDYDYDEFDRRDREYERANSEGASNVNEETVVEDSPVASEEVTDTDSSEGESEVSELEEISTSWDD